MEPGVLGRHRRPGGGGRTPAGAGSRRRPALTTRRTGRLRSAVNLSSLEFAGSPGLEPGLQKEVGALPRSPAVPRVPTRGRPAHAGGSSGEAIPRSAPGNQGSASRLRPISRRLQRLCPPIFKASLPGRQHGGLAPRSGLPVPLHQKAAGASLPRGGRVPGTSS